MDPEREEPEPEPVVPSVAPEPVVPEPKKRGRPKKEPAPKEPPKPRGRPKKEPTGPKAPKEPKKEVEPPPRELPRELVYEDPMEHLAMLLHQHTEDAKMRRREQMRNLLGL